MVLPKLTKTGDWIIYLHNGKDIHIDRTHPYKFSVENISQRGVLEIALSDNYVTFYRRKTQKQKYHKHKLLSDPQRIIQKLFY